MEIKKLIILIFISVLGLAAGAQECEAEATVATWGEAAAETAALAMTDDETPQADAVTKALPVADTEAYKLTADWHKSRMLKTLGWTSLGVGTAMVIGGGVWFMSCVVSDNGDNRDTIGMSTLLATGAVLMVGTVPLLIYSHKYKVKARRGIELAAVLSRVGEPMLNGWSARPAVGFTLKF